MNTVQGYKIYLNSSRSQLNNIIYMNMKTDNVYKDVSRSL